MSFEEKRKVFFASSKECVSRFFETFEGEMWRTKHLGYRTKFKKKEYKILKIFRNPKRKSAHSYLALLIFILRRSDFLEEEEEERFNLVSRAFPNTRTTSFCHTRLRAPSFLLSHQKKRGDFPEGEKWQQRQHLHHRTRKKRGNQRRGLERRNASLPRAKPRFIEDCYFRRSKPGFFKSNRPMNSAGVYTWEIPNRRDCGIARNGQTLWMCHSRERRNAWAVRTRWIFCKRSKRTER